MAPSSARILTEATSPTSFLRAALSLQATATRREEPETLLVGSRGHADHAREPDGSNIETLVDTSEGDARPGKEIKKWCVGIALDVEAGKVYWTQKVRPMPVRDASFAPISRFPRARPSDRKDIELLYENLPEPIDLELDLANRTLYWTDRGDPPRGNTVNRAPWIPLKEMARKTGDCFRPFGGRHRYRPHLKAAACF